MKSLLDGHQLVAIVDKLRDVLRATPEDELEDIIESLDQEYNNEVRAELEALM